MKYDKQYLYDMYNATSTEDENGDLETYENWLERQLISRIESLEQLRQYNVVERAEDLLDKFAQDEGFGNWETVVLNCHHSIIRSVAIAAVNQALHQPLVMESFCYCSKGKGIDHDEDGKAYCVDCGNYLEQTVP